MLQTIKLLQQLQALDIQLYRDGDKLRVRDRHNRLTDEWREQIRARRSLILERLNGREPQALATIYALSPLQGGMLYQSRLTPNQSAYIEQSLWHVDDPAFDAGRLIGAIQTVIDAHDSLRAAFRTDQAEAAIQLIYTHARLPVTVLDWRELAAAEQQQRLAELMAADRLIDFDLAQAPLLRLTIGERAPHGYDLLLTFHHLLLDGWSLDLFWDAVFCAYAGEPLTPSTPYQAFIEYLHQQSADPTFWQSYLAGFTVPTPLPVVTTARSEQGKRLRAVRSLDRANSQQLIRYVRTQGVTLNTLFQAAWALLLARYSGETDLLFGMVTSGRTAPLPGIESILGLCINTLPFRVQLTPDLNSATLLQQVAQTQINLQQREHTALVDLQRWSTLPVGTPLFQTLLLFQNTPQTAYTDANPLNLRPGQSGAGNTGYPLMAVVRVGGGDDTIRLILNYGAEQYEAETVARLITHWEQLALALATQPDVPVQQLPMLTADDYRQVVHDWNAPQGDLPIDIDEPQTIHARFEAQVARTPDAVAVVMPKEAIERVSDREIGQGDTQSLNLSISQSLTYAELNARANQLAHYLRQLGVQIDTPVAIAMERSPAMVVSLFAVLKAGAAYLPIDPSYPPERIRYMLTDSAAPLLLTQSHLAFRHDGIQVLAVDQLATDLAAQPSHNPPTAVSTNDLAYLMYTSGSTGQPKGVLVEHGGVDLVLNAQGKVVPGLTTGSRLLQIASFSFDAATAEILMALVHGATLVMAPANHARSGAPLVDLLAAQRITHVTIVPSVLQTMPAADLPDLQVLITAGEACPAGVVNTWAQRRAFFNFYGPTESPIWTTYSRLQAGEAVHIGRPIPNRKVYLLDANGMLVPPEVGGELYIGGAQLARGYLNRPELTAERFIDHPEFGRLYKTGDWCRWRADGVIEYLGRSDFQVKLHGFRIELGEIEHALLAQAGMRQAAVLLLAETPDAGDPGARLVAFFVGDADGGTLRRRLAQQLPAYLLPSAFVQLADLPRTPNGKLDRNALARSVGGIGGTVSTTSAPAATLDETRLALLWQSVLGVEHIGVEDNFFDVGGYSLLAVTLVERMRQTLQREVTLPQFLKSPTIRGVLRETTCGERATSAFVALRSGAALLDKRPPLFLIHPASGVIFPFANLLPYLGADQPVYALQAHGIYDDLPPFATLEALATAAITEMQQIQPHGPYAIGGWSFGGMAAFEMARQLTQQGETVAFLGLIDVYPDTPGIPMTYEQPSQHAIIQPFFELFGEFIGIEAHTLSPELLRGAAAEAQPLDWLLAQVSEQGQSFLVVPAIVKRIWQTLHHHNQLMQRYQPQPYEGAIALFCVAESAPPMPVADVVSEADYWQSLTRRPVDTVLVDGDHLTMLDKNHVATLGRALAERLQALPIVNRND